MKTIINYLDDLKNKVGSDYKVAQKIGINRANISMIRSRNLMSDETAIKLADALGVSEEEVLIAAAIARSEGPVKAAWLNLAGKIGPSGFLAIADTIHYAKLLSLVYSVLSLTLITRKGNGKTKTQQLLSYPDKTCFRPGKDSRNFTLYT